MPVRAAQAPAHAQHSVVRRLLRYGSVSAISTATSLVVLGVLVGVVGFPAMWANVIATAVGTIPSFELNRRWVWAQRGRALLGQAVPYVVLSFAGLIVSTVAVHVASDATGHSTRLFHTTAVELANISTYGALWVVQFVLCDRILFRPATGTPAAETEGPQVHGLPTVAPRPWQTRTRGGDLVGRGRAWRGAGHPEPAGCPQCPERGAAPSPAVDPA